MERKNWHWYLGAIMKFLLQKSCFPKTQTNRWEPPSETLINVSLSLRFSGQKKNFTQGDQCLWCLFTFLLGQRESTFSPQFYMSIIKTLFPNNKINIPWKMSIIGTLSSPFWKLLSNGHWPKKTPEVKSGHFASSCNQLIIMGNIFVPPSNGKD